MAIFISGIVFAGMSEYYTKRSQPIEPNVVQEELIGNAGKIICILDEGVCDVLNNQTLVYRVIDIPWVLDIGRPFRLSHSAVTHRKDHGYEINLSSHLFTDIAAVTVFLYHELQHVKYSNYSLYEDGSRYVEQCHDHNQVKEKTAEFARMLDHWFASEEGP